MCTPPTHLSIGSLFFTINAVPCHVDDPATATETSLAENIIRVAMHPADQFMAFHDPVVQSELSIEDVALASAFLLYSSGKGFAHETENKVR